MGTIFHAYFMDSQAFSMNTTKSLKKNLKGLNMLQAKNTTKTTVLIDSLFFKLRREKTND